MNKKTREDLLLDYVLKYIDCIDCPAKRYCGEWAKIGIDEYDCAAVIDIWLDEESDISNGWDIINELFNKCKEKETLLDIYNKIDTIETQILFIKDYVNTRLDVLEENKKTNNKATEKQINFIKIIRENIDGNYYITDKELNKLTKDEARYYIDKHIDEFKLNNEMDFVAANPNFASKYM